jgi:hypothetical protein
LLWFLSYHLQEGWEIGTSRTCKIFCFVNWKTGWYILQRFLLNIRFKFSSPKWEKEIKLLALVYNSDNVLKKNHCLQSSPYLQSEGIPVLTIVMMYILKRNQREGFPILTISPSPSKPYWAMRAVKIFLWAILKSILLRVYITRLK